MKRIFAHLHGVPKLMAGLLYGSGLRLMGCVRLRVKDVDFELAQITTRDEKGGKDRITMLPLNLSEFLRRHLVHVKARHEQDVEDGFGRVHLPFALSRKLPNAAREWGWQYVFPSSRISVDPRSGTKQRHHMAERYLAERTQGRGGRCRNSQTRQLPQPAPFLCHAPIGERL